MPGVRLTFSLDILQVEIDRVDWPSPHVPVAAVAALGVKWNCPGLVDSEGLGCKDVLSPAS